MPRKIFIITAFLVLAILLVGFFLVDFFSPHPYALVMQNCGETLSFAGSHITRHSSIESAQGAGNSRLGEYNLASIYKSETEGVFNPLLWMKTTSPICYDGDYLEWTPINTNQG